MNFVLRLPNGAPSLPIAFALRLRFAASLCRKPKLPLPLVLPIIDFAILARCAGDRVFNLPSRQVD